MASLKGKGKNRSTSGKSSGSRAAQKRAGSSAASSRADRESREESVTRSSAVPSGSNASSVSSEYTGLGSELDDFSYSEVLRSVFPNDGTIDAVPPVKSLLALQQDLNILLKKTEQKISARENGINRLKRYADDLEQEKTKQSKQFESERTERSRISTSATEADQDSDASSVPLADENEAGGSAENADSEQENITDRGQSEEPTTSQATLMDESQDNLIETESPHPKLKTDESEEKDDSTDVVQAKESSVHIKSELINDLNGDAVMEDAQDSENVEDVPQKGPVFEKNPKSEFVDSQTLPIAALGLFLDSPSNDGMVQTGEDYLKKKYGVASYPTKDLKDMLPGEIPDQDFTRAKPPNQVQFSTFAAAIEPYFKPYSEEDISFLKQKSVGLDMTYSKPDSISPYIIPDLGSLYTDAWAEEDGSNPGYSLSPVPSNLDDSEINPKGSSDNISDEVLEHDDISCGPLASRLLSALLTEAEDKDAQVTVKSESHEENEDEIAASKEEPLSGTVAIDPKWKLSSVKTDYSTLEDRLKREFRYVGILDVNVLRKDEEGKQDQLSLSLGGNNTKPDQNSVNSELSDGFEIDWVKGREDDEICYELRLLQKRLKQVTKINQACKRRLLPLVQEQMAYQEYTQILDDLDKQVDQAYLKRIRIPKGKKKKGGVAAAAAAAAAAAVAAASNGQSDLRPGLKALLEKRMKWIDKIGPVFAPPEVMKRVPKESIFKDLVIDEDDDDAMEEDDELYTMM